jgi:A/G-specific adenine glycosylase
LSGRRKEKIKVEKPKENIRRKLLRWFKKNCRDLPWRKTRDPYAVWISEIMLQQTQVDTVIPYYQRFLKSFPALKHLAGADLAKVLKLWEGLGYYSRARNLHKASQIIAGNFHGRIPDNSADLLSLPGIGRYTAGAILSIAHNKQAAVLDGNVKRVLSRLFAVSGNPAEKKTEELLWRISDSLVPEKHPGDFNEALMDLGSMVCTPRDPQCVKCPLRDECRGKASGDPERYPSRKIRKPIPTIEAVAAVIVKHGRVLVRQRAAQGLLGGLWEFPNWKMKDKGDPVKLLKGSIRKEMGAIVKAEDFLGTFRHTFSHFKLSLGVYYCQPVHGDKGGIWLPPEGLQHLPMSKLHRRIAQTVGERISKRRGEKVPGADLTRL